MNISIISVQSLQKIFATIAVFAMVFSPFANVPFAQAAHDPFNGAAQTNVTVCHANNGHGAGFTSNTVSISSSGALQGGHDSGNGVHATDIIPPYHYTDKDAVVQSYAGLNWTTPNQAIWNNDCKVSVVGPTTATLTLAKEVIDGTALDTAFTLVATDPTTSISGIEGSDAVTGKVVIPGTYALSETGGPANYTASSYSCVKTGGSAVSGNSITLAAGDVAICTITNTYVPPVYSQSTYYAQSAYSPEYAQSSYYAQSAYNEPKQCIVSSDVTTLGNTAASVNTSVHPAWTTTLSTTASQWIWSADAAQTATFIKSFNVDNAPTGSVLRMAVDNSYTAKLNGTPLSCDGSGILNFENPIDTCTAPVVAGVNTLEVVAQNFGGPNTSDNLAGFIYELVINGSSCSPVPPPKKHRIEGYKFNDVNGNGIWEEEEPSLSGWTINLFNNTTESGTTTVTDEGGFYSFNVADGNYQVTETQQQGWEQTTTVGDGADGDTCYYNLTGTSDAPYTCTFANHQSSVAQCIYPKENLLVNGSFEDPVVAGGGWGLFTTMTGWVSSSLDGFEVWNNLFGPASAGLQNIELDVNAPTSISQKVATVIGNVYKVSFDFAARPGRNLADNQMNVMLNGVTVGTVGANGSADTVKNWVTYSYAFTAASTTTEVKFSDIGTSNGYGTLLDKTVVCLTEDNFVPTYPVFGYVWNDADQDGPTVPSQEVGEVPLEGWIVTATKGAQTFSTTTRANGYYLFNLPEGTWTISDGTPADWNQTYPLTVGNVHVVTVPNPFLTLENDTSFLAQVMNVLIPTVYAQVQVEEELGSGPYNFGNFFAGGSSSNGGGGSSSGSRRKRTTSEDRPVPQVLGEATSALPVGAPNTGAGGSSNDATLPSLVLALSATRTSLRKSK